MFKPYQKYKNIGHIDIPVHWNELEFNRLFTKKEIANCPQEKLLSVYLDRGVIPYSEGGGLVHKPSESLEKYQLVEVNDFVMNNQQAWRGSVGISKYRGIVSPAYLVFTPDHYKLMPKYLNYLLRDKYIVGEFMNCSLSVGTIQRQIKFHLLKKVNIPFPNIAEQTQIATYLDQETQKIDNLILKQEKLIELLEEQRKSIISHAVTKGIDPHAKMKDSGVEWLGEVPEHWGIHRFSSIFIENKRKNKGMLSDNLLSLSYGKIIEKDIHNVKGLVPENFETYQIIYPNDIVFRFTDLQNDKRSLRSAISKFKGIITSAYISVSSKTDNLDMNYYAYLFRTYDLMKVFYSMGDGMRQSLKMSELNRMLILVPEKSEQQQIINFIETENKKIDQLIQKQTALIEKLKEYRSSIISHAVTGKIDVRHLIS
ncbi:hypothetical protein B0186_03175 [Canicola haemoglobinophilus]|uniref:Probable type I restriction modification system, specificity component HsdS2 n=1 Tax=Canicola haemoglobinophilus TaxID=733 RepID=A0A1V4B2D0_9PAST|nr:restriction endonuclease subunit S [Canicola haemoglobinophilus]OOS01429.1 hypothetical protein B0186_03175 [Canicola haemoglobinophilus]STO59876.1 Probable type I restriction modification system, specificity component HsdS2 [Canicola haemoglobinophilus]